ncbi:MAG TPA: metallophosphoesterase family protein [Rudaea sp.]|jgi:putative phosphoesterase|nr:metallophosphoesterase family protein [Rudaea sp.]
MRVGLISDTHGLLRPEAKVFLEGCARIIHGGDIGNPDILAQLAALAPLTVVRGNNDHGDWAEGLADTQFVRIDDVLVYVIHDIAQLDIDPGAAHVRVVVSGHSHAPAVVERNGVLYVNPGSAGPRRFKLPIAAGELTIAGNAVSARIVRLDADVAAHAKG